MLRTTYFCAAFLFLCNFSVCTFSSASFPPYFLHCPCFSLLLIYWSLFLWYSFYLSRFLVFPNLKARWKTQQSRKATHEMERKYLQNIWWSISRIYKTPIAQSNKQNQTNQFKKWAKDLHSYSTKNINNHWKNAQHL